MICSQTLQRRVHWKAQSRAVIAKTHIFLSERVASFREAGMEYESGKGREGKGG